MEEKDLFDLFREGSEDLTEQPSQESWQRLEKRLTRKREVKRQRPLLLQLNVVVTVVLLLLGVAAIGLYVAREHEAALKSEKQFKELEFLIGKWSASHGKIEDDLVFELIPNIHNSKILRGVKTVKFSSLEVSKDTILIEKKGKILTLTANRETQKLTTSTPNTVFEFGETRLRRSADDRFSLSFGMGSIFLYKKRL